jgi:MFS family permease
MYPFGGILLAPLVAAYLASVLSRFSSCRRRRPGWMVGIGAIFGGVIASWIGIFQLDLFRPWTWSYVGGKDDLLPLLIFTGFLAGFVGILPAAWVVDRHQKQYDETHDLA